MSVPGSNLLRQALRIIKPQSVQYYVCTGRTNNARGLLETAYAPAAARQGSVQAVPRRLYAIQGLDMQKDYVNFFQPANATDVARDTAGDQFAWAGKRWQILSNTPWFDMDGWTQSLAVKV